MVYVWGDSLMTRKYRTIVIEEIFAQMAEEQAREEKRSLSNQVEVDIEKANKK